ncbi:MAG TPA: hypothetical protein VIE88_13585 [Vicinamibacteria bacterium]|jgi:hypothetical protein
MLLPSLALVLVFYAGHSGQDCPVCSEADPAAVSAAKRNLEEAFALALTLPDCSGTSNLDSCRTLERLLTEASDSLRKVVESHRIAEANDCLSCDPRSEITPLALALMHLGKLLEEKGHGDFAPSLRRMEAEIESWKSARCCAPDGKAEKTKGPKPADRENDARAILTEKCGADFVVNRRGLRQVMRSPGERQGCYQSRACRKTESREGLAIEAGFWTYDGEYWYIWAERRTPQGEWVTCEP